MREIKFKVIDVEKLIIEIQENANIGDIINLRKNTTDVDFFAEQIRKTIESDNDNFIQQKIEEETKKRKQVWAEEGKKEYLLSNAYKNLQNSNTNLSSQLKSAETRIEEMIKSKDENVNSRVNELFKTKELELQKEIEREKISKTKLEEEKKALIEKNTFEIINFSKEKDYQLENEINKLKLQFNQEMQNEKDKVKQLLNEKENFKKELKTNEEKMKFELKSTINEKELEYTKKTTKQNQKFKDEIAILNSRLQKFQKYQRLLNIKTLGEKLETECLENFEQYVSSDEVTFEKTTIPINRNKPDFLYTVRSQNGNKLLSAVLEMKTNFGTDTENPRNNSDHYAKLEKDRVNFEAEYSILVSELELDKLFLIKKVADSRYKNMYVIRPDFFVGFLNLLKTFALKRSKTIIDEINFKAKNSILEDFDDFKSTIVDNQLDKIEKNVAKINSSADIIKKQAANIEENTRVIINSHVQVIKNKINDFKIEKKIVKKIDDINEE